MELNIDLGFFKSLEQADQDRAIYEAALNYIKLGFKVLPQKPDTKGFIRNLSIEHATSMPEIVKHWFGPGGPYEGYNILGINPSGIVALDFDKHGKADGFANSGLDLHDLTGLRVITPGGGCHFYTSDKVSFIKKIPGIDKKTACLLPPSTVNGVRYYWDTGGEPGSIPEKMLEALGGKVPKKKEVEEFAVVAPDDYIKELLTYFDPGCDYDEWRNVGMALHDNDPGRSRLDLWIEWSQGSDKFQPGECEKRWDTFSTERSRKVTLAWMIATARQRGRAPTAADIKYSGINIDAYEAVLKMNERFMCTTQGGNSIICISKDADGNERHTRTTPGDFKGLVAANLPPIMVGEKYVPAAEYWLKSKYRREGDIVMEYPGTEREGDLNQYQGFAIKPVECQPEDVQFFLDHVKYVICDGNEKHAEFLLDMLAAKMQKPLDLLGIALVLAGREGTGKSAFGEIFRLIIGPTHATKVSTRDALLGAYSGGMSSMIFVSGEEAVFSAHKGEAERLKALITESPLDWNNKFIKPWSQRNCLFLMFTANENWVIPAGFDSRRFLVLKVSDIRMMDTDYWQNKYMPLLYKDHRNQPNNPEYLGKVLYYLLTRTITHDLSRAMVTEELIEQRKLTNAESMEAAFCEWTRQTFIESKGDEAMLEGAGKEFSFPVVTFKQEQWVEVNNMYYDFRSFYTRRYSKGRGCGTEKDFKERLSALGITIIRVKKNQLKVGAGKYPGEPDSKIRIGRRVSPDAIENRLAEQYPLFMDLSDEEAPDDSE